VLDGERRLIAFNKAKMRRSPKSRVGEICYKCFKDGNDTEFCENCPVLRVINSNPIRSFKGISYHPTSAMISCVPILGPNGNLRAVAEFIDEISGIVNVRDCVDNLNRLTNESDIIKTGMKYMTDLVSAIRSILIKIDTENDMIYIYGDESGVRNSAKRYRIADVQFLQNIIEDHSTLVVDDIRNEINVPASIKRFSIRYNLQSFTFIPVTDSQGKCIAIIAIESIIGKTPLPEDTIEHCLTLARCISGALARASEHKLVSTIVNQRNKFILLLESVVDIFDPDIALQQIINGIPEVINDVAASAYRCVSNHQNGTINNTLEFIHGAGSDEFVSNIRKWRTNRKIRTSIKTYNAINR